MSKHKPDRCPPCEGDGYLEEWNADQSGVIEEVCWCSCHAGGVMLAQYSGIAASEALSNNNAPKPATSPDAKSATPNPSTGDKP